MRRPLPQLLFLCCLATLLSPLAHAQSVELDLLGRYETGLFDEGAAEIAAYDPATQRLFFVNSAAVEVVALDVSDPADPVEVLAIDADVYGNGANSVAVSGGLVAVAIEADPSTDPGKVVFFDTDGSFLGEVTVGVLPDMLLFTPDGQKVLTANEGEPNDDYTVDPEGSVSIISLAGGVAGATVTTVGFSDFNAGGPRAGELPSDVRVFGPGATVAQDLEPEYIALSGDGQTAYVALQENNALALVDVPTARVTEIVALGTKDYSLPQNPIDASNEDGAINIQNRPVLSFYQPDAIASFVAGGETFIVTANEGDARDYDGFSEEERAADLVLDPAAFPDAAALQAEANLGRLLITTANGDTDGDGDYDVIYGYGGRSFAIWDAMGNLVYDSADDFERITADRLPDYFNANNDENDSFDSRSDDKGPEPEGVTTGTIGGRTYAFVGLERIGGVMVYDVTSPTAPRFVTYTNTRDFSVRFDVDEEGDPDPTSEQLAAAGDLGPEGIVFVPAGESPNGMDLLIVANEVSGTVAFYEVRQETDVSPPECGVIATETDVEGRLVAVQTSVRDGESGIARAAFKRLRNLSGFLGAGDSVLGPFEQGDEQTFEAAATPEITIRGERMNLTQGGAIVVEVTNGAGLTALCDPVLTTLSGGVPEAYRLGANWPNPFNPETRIAFDVREATDVRLDVYDALGRLVATLAEGPMEAGSYEVTWDGRDLAGRPLASGVYVYRMRAGAFTQARSMVLLK